MKKIISFILVLTVVLSLGIPVKASGGISVTIDGETVLFPDQQPIMMNDRVLVPLRAIFEALGATVVWNDANQSAFCKRANTSIMVTINSSTMMKNGKVTTLDQPAILLNDRTLVPVRAVSEGLGATVDWDDATQTVIIVK